MLERKGVIIGPNDSECSRIDVAETGSKVIRTDVKDSDGESSEVGEGEKRRSIVGAIVLLVAITIQPTIVIVLIKEYLDVL